MRAFFGALAWRTSWSAADLFKSTFAAYLRPSLPILLCSGVLIDDSQEEGSIGL
jgi:hypothetical protein